MHISQNVKLAEAIAFAFDAHSGQTRKGSSEPYILHPLRILTSLIEIGIKDFDVLCASVLHDTIEDCDVSGEILKQKFGETVSNFVLSLTDDKTLPRDERKNKSRNKISQASPEVKLIKAADRYDNLNGKFPSFWTTEKKQQYLKESKLLIEAVLNNLYDVRYSALIQQFVDAIASKVEELEQQAIERKQVNDNS